MKSLLAILVLTFGSVAQAKCIKVDIAVNDNACVAEECKITENAPKTVKITLSARGEGTWTEKKLLQGATRVTAVRFRKFEESFKIQFSNYFLKGRHKLNLTSKPAIIDDLTHFEKELYKAPRFDTGKVVYQTFVELHPAADSECR